MRTREEKWRCKGSHSSSVSGSNRLVWLQTWKKAMGWCTAQWKMLLFCGSVLSRCFLVPLGVLLVMKTLEDEWMVVIMAYRLAVFEILRGFFCISIIILHVHVIPTYRVYWLYDMIYLADMLNAARLEVLSEINAPRNARATIWVIQGWCPLEGSIFLRKYGKTIN